MPTIDPRIDAYIAESAEFAQPILTHLREVIHAACPQVQETMKWSRPHFVYNGLLCGMSAFKAHCGFGFWKGALMFPGTSEREAAGHFGRITSVKDLPSIKVLAGYVKQAMLLNDEDAKAPRLKRPACAGWTRRSSGLRRARAETGSTRSAETGHALTD